MASLYHAGAEEALPHVFKIGIPNKVSNPTHADLVMRWIEFWCQTNCDCAWAVDEGRDHVVVSFENELDAVMFKLSPEFNPP